MVSLTSFGKCPSLEFTGWILSCCRLTQSVELHEWTMAKDLSLDFPLAAWFCSISVLQRLFHTEVFKGRLQNIVVESRKPWHLYADWSKWSFTLIWSEQSSAIWKYRIFTQCIKAECIHLLLGALKMFFTTAFYVCVPCQWMWVFKPALLLGFHLFLPWHNCVILKSYLIPKSLW